MLPFLLLIIIIGIIKIRKYISDWTSLEGSQSSIISQLGLLKVEQWESGKSKSDLLLALWETEINDR